MKAPMTIDVCKRCGLPPEPATMYCGHCWYLVESLRDALGYVFDSDGEWDPSCRYTPTPRGTDA